MHCNYLLILSQGRHTSAVTVELGGALMVSLRLARAILLGVFGAPLAGLTVACTPQGIVQQLWVSDIKNNRILRFSVLSTTGNKGVAGNANLVLGQPDLSSNGNSNPQNNLSLPEGIAFDSNGNLWVADSGNCRVVEFTQPFSNGKPVNLIIGQPKSFNGMCDVLGGMLRCPMFVAMDGQGDLFVSDCFAGLNEFKPPLTISSAPIPIGTTADCSPGQQPLTASDICSAAGLAFDPAGNL